MAATTSNVNRPTSSQLMPPMITRIKATKSNVFSRLSILLLPAWLKGLSAHARTPYRRSPCLSLNYMQGYPVFYGSCAINIPQPIMRAHGYMSDVTDHRLENDSTSMC